MSYAQDLSCRLPSLPPPSLSQFVAISVSLSLKFVFRFWLRASTKPNGRKQYCAKERWQGNLIIIDICGIGWVGALTQPQLHFCVRPTTTQANIFVCCWPRHMFVCSECLLAKEEHKRRAHPRQPASQWSGRRNAWRAIKLLNLQVNDVISHHHHHHHHPQDNPGHDFFPKGLPQLKSRPDANELLIPSQPKKATARDGGDREKVYGCHKALEYHLHRG